MEEVKPPRLEKLLPYVKNNTLDDLLDLEREVLQILSFNLI